LAVAGSAAAEGGDEGAVVGELLDAIVASNFTFIEPDGMVKNRDEYLADRSSDTADIESFGLADVKVSVFENCALASGVSKITECR